jgi:NAD(P)-dependent dehydrogenase (short-subunit alcohol dehydrogenase family)
VPPEERRAIVVGASSGMGAALVRRLAREGYRVAALARRAEMLATLAAETRADAERTGGAVLVRAHDVARTGEVPRLFEELVRELGGLDLLIYAAGIMPEIGKDEYDTGKDLSILDVNLAGCAAWCNPPRTSLRPARGHPGQTDRGRPRLRHPMYCTSKAAMNTYLGRCATAWRSGARARSARVRTRP